MWEISAWSAILFWACGPQKGMSRWRPGFGEQPAQNELVVEEVAAGADELALDSFHVAPVERVSGLSRQSVHWKVQKLAARPVDAQDELTVSANDMQHSGYIEISHFGVPARLTCYPAGRCASAQTACQA